MAASIDEIRTWGMDNGWAEVIQPEGRLPTGLRAAYDARETISHGAVKTDWPAAPLVTEPFQHNGQAYDLPPVGDPEQMDERAPQLPKATPVRSLVERVKQAAPGKKTTTRGKKPSKPRVPVDRLISKVWQGLAQMMQPINLPVARVLDVQAPVAGLLLEDIVRNTVVDRVLQPVARIEQGGEMAFALIGPPLLVAAIQAKPEMHVFLVPMLKESLRTWIDVAGPKLEEISKRDEAFQEKYGTRIDDMISMFFAPSPDQTEAAE